MSLGGEAYSSYCDSSQSATKAAIDNLRSSGIATIIASGNDGYCGSINAPACISTAVSVGATTKLDQEAVFNNYAPILALFAPGYSIYSSVPGGWGYKNGTSMAAPHVAGAWAILKQYSPLSTVSDILTSLQNTGVSIANACAVTGNYPQRRIDVLAALYALPDTIPPTVSAFSVTPSSVIFGNSFTISYTVSDTGSSGLNRVELWRANDSGSSPVGWAEIKRTYLSGNGPTSGSFSDAPTSTGTYWYWYGIRAVDNEGNWSVEPNPPGTIKVTVTAPDLTGTWTSLTQTCKNTMKGIKCKIKGRLNIQNIGNWDALSSFVRFYLSDDNTYDGGDTFLKQVATGKIKKGKSKNRTLSYSFPLGVTVSGKYIIAVIDADNTVVEANETNNNITYGPIP